MKYISHNKKETLKRCGIVMLSSVMILTGTLAMNSTVDHGRIIAKDEGVAYADVAAKTEKSIDNSFPELSSSKSSDKLSKDETVYVIMDADGNKEETVVSEWLKNPEKLESIKDRSTLSEITNTSGDEEFTKDGSEVVWNAAGNDIKYTGKTDKDLPVSCEVTYYLNGEEVSAEEIAGQKGEIEIHFDYFVNVHDRVKVDGKGYDIEHPYIMASGLMLDNEHFRDVEVTNGKCISEGGNTICLGIALPGIQESLAMKEDMIDIPDSVVVKAVTDEFQIDGTYTVALTGLLGELDLSSNDVTDKLGEVESALDKLSDASSKLVKGSNALKKGTDALEDGTSALSSGASSLKNGTSQLRSKSGALSSGVNKLYKGSKSLSQGTKAIKSGTKQAVKGAKQLSDGLSTLSDNSEALNEATEKLESNIFENANTQLKTALIEGGMSEGMAKQFTLEPDTYTKVIDGLKSLVPSRVSDLEELQSTLDNLEEYVKAVKAYTDGVDKSSEGMDTYYSQMKKLGKGAKQVNKGASAMKKGLSALADNIPALKKGIRQLDNGASQLDSGASQLDDGTEKLSQGASELAKGMNQFDKQGIKKFVNALDEYDLNDMLTRVEAVSEASSNRHFVGGTRSKIAGESKIIFKTKEVEIKK